MTQTLPSIDSAYREEWHAARDAREQQRRDPYGYLAYAGFHKLSNTPAHFDGIPGIWTSGPDGISVLVDSGEQLTVDGRAVTGSYRFAAVREREFRRVALAGDVILELSKRGGQDLLRPIDPAVGRRVIGSYDHTPAFELSPRWIVEGRFVPFDELRPTSVDATVGDIVHVHLAAGEVIFSLDGVEHRWLVIARDGQPASAAGTGVILFTDATNVTTTDPRGRSLEVEFPSGPGPVTLDFNHTRNLQRPYTAFAPCPLSPPQNSTSTAVEAGEQSPVFTA